MNRKVSSLFVALVLVLAASSASAAAKGDKMVGLAGGLSVPSGDLSKDFTVSDPTQAGLAAGMGFNGGAFFDYMVTENVAVGIDGNFQSFSLKTSQRDALRTLSGDPGLDVKYTGIGGHAHVKFMMPMKESPVAPYLVAGAGVTRFKAKLEGATPSDTSVTKFGGFGGVGFGYKAGGNAAVGLEAGYHIVPIGDLYGVGKSKTAAWIELKAIVSFALGSSGGATSKMKAH